MTREEREFAKSRIEYLLKISSFVFDERDREALDMAILALSQEPTKREMEREYLFQSLCEDFKKLQAENDDLRKRLEQEPCTDAVSRGVFEQVMWERDIAIEQLHELGYELGQKIEPCDDAISRNMALEKMADYVASGYADSAEDFEEYSRIICQLPSVTQKSIECNDAISRDAVKDILNNSYSLTDAEHRVEQLPSVKHKSETVTEFADRCRECGKMRKGHWIYDETLENWRCSKCNETPKTMGYVGTADFMAEHFKFCNHCGAKMESED